MVLVSFTLMLWLTWGGHVVDKAIYQTFGTTTGSYILWLILIVIPLFAPILLKVILRDKLSGWGYVIIPDISVCIVCPLGLLIFYKYYFACL